MAVIFNGKRIDAVTFDFWWTLFKDSEGRADTSVLELRLEYIKNVASLYRKKVATEDAKKAFESARNFFERNHKRGLFTPPDLIARKIFSELDIELSFHEARIISEKISQLGIYANLALIEGADELLLFLKSRGIRIGLISDTVMTKGKHLVWHMRKYRILQHFDYLVFSDEIATVKPDIAAFEIASRKLGVKPNSCIHIGDFPWSDIEGAKRCGFIGIQFTGGMGPEAKNIHPKADFVAKSFEEIIQLFEQKI